MKISAFSCFVRVAGVSCLSVGACFFTLGGCSSDDAKSPAAAAAGESNQAQGGDGSTVAGGAPSSGGSPASSMAGANPDEPSVGGAGAGFGGAAPMVTGGCRVELSLNTSNAIDPGVPLDQKCEVYKYTDQVNFDVTNGAAPDLRQINVDFFEPPVAGASAKVEDGSDFAGHQGTAVSYIDSNGVWNADKGTVTLVSVSGDDMVLQLKDVHFAVQAGPGVTNTGEFVANGTISGVAMATK